VVAHCIAAGGQQGERVALPSQVMKHLVAPIGSKRDGLPPRRAQAIVTSTVLASPRSVAEHDVWGRQEARSSRSERALDGAGHPGPLAKGSRRNPT
jgi:hypothetical protein